LDGSNLRLADGRNVTVVLIKEDLKGIASKLIKMGASLSVEDGETGQNLLQLANSPEHKGYRRATLSSDKLTTADICFQNRHQQTILHYLALSGDGEGVAQLCSALPVEIRSRVVNLPDEKGRRALHFAAYSGNRAAVEALLNNGAVPDSSDYKGRNALHYSDLRRDKFRMSEGVFESQPDEAFFLPTADRASDVSAGEHGDSPELDRLLGILDSVDHLVQRGVPSSADKTGRHPFGMTTEQLREVLGKQRLSPDDHPARTGDDRRHVRAPDGPERLGKHSNANLPKASSRRDPLHTQTYQWFCVELDEGQTVERGPFIQPVSVVDNEGTPTDDDGTPTDVEESPAETQPVERAAQPRSVRLRRRPTGVATEYGIQDEERKRTSSNSGRGDSGDDGDDPAKKPRK
jgi:hypothetical protein